ncbi:III protein [Hyaloraphidium curvatum]|nr:III protein [Hyaloraphidium curvatum]
MLRAFRPAMKPVAEISADLCRLIGLPDPAPLAVAGHEPVHPSSFRVDAAAAASIGAAAAAAEAVWRHRTRERRAVSVDLRHAAAEFRSERLITLAGKPPPDPWDPLAGAYRTADGWVRVHTNFPHHRAGILRLLDLPDTAKRDDVAAALLARKAEEFETAAADAGMCVAAYRTHEQWLSAPQSQAQHAQTPILITPIAPSPPLPFSANPTRPLSGLRVLDLTRIIAGPVAARTLAAHGASVLSVTSPHLPNIPSLLPDTNRGKRACHIDLETPEDTEKLKDLVREADVFLQSYRPGSLSSRGFSPESLAALKPGIVVAQLSAYAPGGPWEHRRGFDSLVQTATGINADEAAAFGSDAPRPLPCQALDHGAGQLLALGIAAAKLRQATEGGSWLVRVSLQGTAEWLKSLGRIEGMRLELPGFGDLMEGGGRHGGEEIAGVRHAGVVEGMDASLGDAGVPGEQAAEWW